MGAQLAVTEPQAETEPPIFEYAVISGTVDNVETRLCAAGKEGWLLNGMSTCAVPQRGCYGNVESSIMMTCVIMRQGQPEEDGEGSAFPGLSGIGGLVDADGKPAPDQRGKGGS